MTRIYGKSKYSTLDLLNARLVSNISLRDVCLNVYLPSSHKNDLNFSDVAMNYGERAACNKMCSVLFAVLFLRIF